MRVTHYTDGPNRVDGGPMLACGVYRQRRAPTVSDRPEDVSCRRCIERLLRRIGAAPFVGGLGTDE